MHLNRSFVDIRNGNSKIHILEFLLKNQNRNRKIHNYYSSNFADKRYLNFADMKFFAIKDF
jgi:hypothetical protein